MHFDRTGADAAELVIQWDRIVIQVPIRLMPESG